jgi:hypothetical protein
MKVWMTRNTGFFGFASPLQLYQEKQKRFLLNEGESKELSFEPDEEIQVKFFLLKSKPYLLSEKDANQELEIRLNPQVKYRYLSLFVLFLFIPLLQLSLVLVFLILVVYVLFLINAVSKVYVIKERSDG